MHALVDPAETLGAVDVAEHLECAGGLCPLRRELGPCDLCCLHAGAEAHGGVCLRDAPDHPATDSGEDVCGAEAFDVVFGFGGDEEEHGAF